MNIFKKNKMKINLIFQLKLLLLISFFKLNKADICIYSNNEMYVEKDAKLKETKIRYIKEKNFSPHNTFFGECDFSEINQPLQTITLTNILNVEITLKYKAKPTINNEYETESPTDTGEGIEIDEYVDDINDFINSDIYSKCTLLTSTSGLANPYSDELTGIQNAHIHKGYMIDINKGVVASINCGKDSSAKCSTTVNFDFNYSSGISTSFTIGSSHSKSITLGSSRQEQESSSLQDSIATTVEESVCKTDTQEDSRSRAIELSNTITSTEENSIQKTNSKETNESDTITTTKDFQDTHTKNKDETTGEESGTTTTKENGRQVSGGGSVSIGIDGIFNIGAEGSYTDTKNESTATTNSKTKQTTNGEQNGTTRSEGSSDAKTKGSSTSESTTDSKSDSISEARTNGETSTNSNSISNSVARTNGGSTSNTHTETKDIGVTNSSENSTTDTDDTNWSLVYEENKSSTESITVSKTFDANPGESCDYYISYSSYIINEVYECVEKFDNEDDYEYYQNQEPEVKYVLVHVAVPDISKSDATEENKDKIRSIMASRPQCVPSGSKIIDYYYFQDITFDNANFHSNPLNAMKGVSYLCSDGIKCDIQELHTSFGGNNNGVIFKQENSSSNFVLREGSTNFWETYTYGFTPSKTYFRISKLGHGEIVTSDFLGYDKSTYGAEFKNVDYSSNPDYDKENDYTRQILDLEKEYFGAMEKPSAVLKTTLKSTITNTKTSTKANKNSTITSTITKKSNSTVAKTTKKSSSTVATTTKKSISTITVTTTKKSNLAITTTTTTTTTTKNSIQPTSNNNPVDSEDDLFNSFCYSDFLLGTFDENENIKIIEYEDDEKSCNKHWPCADIEKALSNDEINCNLVCLNENYIKPYLEEDYIETMELYDYEDQYNELVDQCDCSDIESKCIGSYYTQEKQEETQETTEFNSDNDNIHYDISKPVNTLSNICNHFLECANNGWEDESCEAYESYYLECNARGRVSKRSVNKEITLEKLEKVNESDDMISICNHYYQCMNENINDDSCKNYTKYKDKCNYRSMLEKRASNIEVIKGERVIWSTVGPGYQHSKVGFSNDLQGYKLVVSEKDSDLPQYTFNGLSLYDDDKIMIWSSNPQSGGVTVNETITNGFYLPEFYGYPFLDGSITDNINYRYRRDKHVNLKKYEYIEENYMLFNGCNHFLKQGQGIRSENKRFALILQDTGNLIFKDNKVTIWESQTAKVWFGQPPYTLHLHEDGTLQVLDKNNYIVFNTVNYENMEEEDKEEGKKENMKDSKKEDKIESKEENKEEKNTIDINKINYRLEVLNSGTFRIMNSKGEEIWNMWKNKGMNELIKYKEIQKRPLCNVTFRPNSFQYLSSSSKEINHILVGERLYNELILTDYDEEKKEKVTYHRSTANMYLSGAYIYFEDFNTEEYRIMNPITERNPRIVEGRLSDEGVFNVYDAYNNTLFTTGVQGARTKENETYYMFLTMKYHPDEDVYESSHINIIHHPSNELLWIFPPQKYTDLRSDEPEVFIRTLDGIIYNNKTNEVINSDIGSITTNYTNVGMCLLLRPDGAYAYGDSKPFFPKNNSKQLSLSEKDGGIYIDGEKFQEIPEIVNKPTRLHCALVDETYELVLEDSEKNIVWQYPPIYKYSISNKQRNNTLYIGNKLWYTQDEYCLSFNETGLYIQTEISNKKVDTKDNTKDNKENNTNDNTKSSENVQKYSTVAILPSKDGGIFTIDPNESSAFNIVDKSGHIENYISIDNPEKHNVIMKCLSKTSVAIFDESNNQVLWSYPVTQYEVLHLNSKLYMDQQLVEKDDGKKTCLNLKEDGIYFHGQKEPLSKLSENANSIILKTDGIYDNVNSSKPLIDFELAKRDWKEEELKANFTLQCETYNGVFGMVLSLNQEILWRYPKYNVKTKLKSNDILYDSEILYDESGSKPCIQLKKGSIYFSNEEKPMNITYLSSPQIMGFNSEIQKDIHYIQVTNAGIDGFNLAKVKLGTIPINNNNRTDSIELFCSEIKGAYRFEIRNSENIISIYPNLETKYILNENDKLYEGESLRYRDDSNIEKNCVTVHGNKITFFDSKEPFYEGNGTIDYIMLSPSSIDVSVNGILKSIQAIDKVRDKKAILHCKNYYYKDRVIIETEDSSTIYYSYPEYKKKLALVTSKGLTPEEGNHLLVGENLIYSENEELSCLLLSSNQVIYPETSKNIFGINFSKGFQLFITNENKLVVNSQNGVQTLTEIYKFPTQKTVSLRCEQIDNKNALVAESDGKIIFLYPERTFEYLRSDSETHLSLYDKLIDKKGNVCIMIQPDGIYKTNDILEFQKAENLKYIYMDSKTGSVKFDNGTTWIDFSGRDVKLPTTMECINNEGSYVLQIKDNDGKALYYKKLNSNDGVCNHNNFIESYIYNNAICPGNKLYYEGTEQICLHYDKSKKGIYDGEGFKLFDASTSENLELDPETGELKLGSTTLLSFENPKLPLKLTCELVNNVFTTVIKESDGNYLWMHRQGRQCDQLVSNDKNCNKLYVYEGIYNTKNQLVMSLTDKGISGIQEDIFTKGVLYMQIENNGAIKTNKGVIFQTDHKTFPPYSFVRKESTITNDKGSFYQLVNAYEEAEYAVPAEQRRKRPVWNLSEINTDESKRGRMYLGDTLDCGTYGLSIRSDKIVIREYYTGNEEVLWKNLDGEVDYAQLNPSDGTFVVTDITNRQPIGSIGKADAKTTAPYTMKCIGNGKVSITNNEGVTLSTFPQPKTLSSLITGSNSLLNNMELCEKTYCCLSLIDNVAYYINKNGKKETLNKKETKITVNNYGQLLFSSNSKTIGSKKESGKYTAKCDSKNGLINIYNEKDKLVNQYPVQGKYVTFRAHNGSKYYIGVNAITKELNPVKITSSDSWQYYHTWYWKNDGSLAITDNNKKVTDYCLSLNSAKSSSYFSLKKCSDTSTRFKTLANYKDTATINSRKAQLLEIFDDSGKAITYNNKNLCVENSNPLKSYYCNSNLKSNTGLCWTIADA